MKYRIILANGRRISVEGRPITFTGFDEFKFILHYLDDSTVYGPWRVAELKTGRFYATGETPNEALRRAKHLLFESGRRYMRGAIQDNLKGIAEAFGKVKQ